VLSGAALTRRAEGYRVSYRVDDGQTTGLATGSSSSGIGVAIKGDAVRLLHSLPDEGSIAFSIAVPVGPVLEGRPPSRQCSTGWRILANGRLPLDVNKSSEGNSRQEP
jgi:hypothetical protein